MNLTFILVLVLCDLLEGLLKFLNVLRGITVQLWPSELLELIRMLILWQ